VRTLLSQFCEEFGEVVHPLIDPLTQSSESLAAVDDQAPVRTILPGLRDSHHQLSTLANKVEEQQAYVLIFGPLKSGKSTLMNAIAGSYVSEVTALPAYPCMVFVSYSKQREYVVTRFNGQVDTLHDQAALRMHINRAHSELAERIREVERTGADFDPGAHFPDAIRRLDVRVPASQLKKSGTVVVDTPGLYTSMKFGYSQLTREFRDTATCAVFVVKSDNLFLEQVFREFHQLLELFSRIFLVVNLDTAKKDLRPDGSLVPSLESEDPLRLIEAFENLSMSTPLKEAAEDGRLQIYPADLLKAASKRLRDSADDPSEDSELANRDDRQSDFDGFLGDLTSYLNSTDYMVAFLGDSLRQVEGVLVKLNNLLGHDSVQELNNHVRELEAQLADAQQRATALVELQDFGWGEAFTDLGENLAEDCAAEDEALYDQTAKTLSSEIVNWFHETSSLRSLVDDDLGIQLRRMQAEGVSNFMAALRRRIHRGSGGVTLPSEIDQAIRSCGIDLKAIGGAAVEEIDGGSAIEFVHVPLQKADIPVRKSFWDWLFFRSHDKVRARLLGPKAEHRLTRPVKAKRFGETARIYMQGEVSDFLNRYFPQNSERLALWIAQSYAHFAVTEILQQLEDAAAAAQAKVASAEAGLAQVAELREHLALLESAVVETSTRVEALGRRYGETQPELLDLSAHAEPIETIPKTLQSATEPDPDAASEVPAEAPLGLESDIQIEEPLSE
jgi:GTPase SAR1 family protein/phage shock protein A